MYGSMTNGPVTGVVVPVTAGPNSQLASEFTPAMTDLVGGPARFITIVPDDVDQGDREQRPSNLARETMAASGIEGELDVLHGPDPARGLVTSVRPDELVLVGAPSSGPISPLFGETVPGLLAARADGPVVIVRNIEPQQTRPLSKLLLRMR